MEFSYMGSSYIKPLQDYMDKSYSSSILFAEYIMIVHMPRCIFSLVVTNISAYKQHIFNVFVLHNDQGKSKKVVDWCLVEVATLDIWFLLVTSSMLSRVGNE